MSKSMSIFHAKVDSTRVDLSDAEAFRLAEEFASAVTAAGGELSVGPNYGDDFAFLVIQLPASSKAEPSDLVPGVKWAKAITRQVPKLEDQHVPDDEVVGA